MLYILYAIVYAFTAQTQEIELATFNVGLAYSYVALAKERKPLILKKLLELSSDAVCLQEVWAEQDVEDFIVETKKNYPFHARVMGKQKISHKRPACFPHNLFGPGKFGSCLLTQCATKRGDDLTTCVLNSCHSSLEKIKKERPLCLEAIVTQVGKSKTQAFVNLFNPFSAIKLFTYEGQAGILLLSKWPLEKIQVIDYLKESTIVRRAAIFAQLKKKETKLNLGCTHLTANLEQEVPYPSTLFASWGSENFWQMKNFIEQAQKFAQNEPLALMGDFNCSNQNTAFNIVGDMDASCNIPIQNGFKSTGPQECTYCKNNPLVHGSGNMRIDHIFSKNINMKESSVFLKELTPITGHGLVPLSDHYALKTIFTIKNKG